MSLNAFAHSLVRVARRDKNESFDSGFGHVVLSGKNNGVNPLNVIRHHGSINKEISLNSRRIKT